MDFLLDEDVDVRVGGLLADGSHEVFEAREIFGVQTKDDENVAWARSQKAILVTGDRRLATKLRGSRSCGCLFLRDLGSHEFDRVRELLAVIEMEVTIQQERFWMQISPEMYIVGR
jgi:predicted nuclease of predicted toxin-antitoxin system